MKLLVIGGTGSFGSIICAQLHEESHGVVAAGRDPARGARLMTDHPGVGFVVLDRSTIVAADLEGYDAVIDAAGPFHRLDRRLPRLAIAAGIDYVDIADDRDFVVGIDELDEDARAAGVRIVSGASSVPALSGAVADQLACGMDRVDLVEGAISASSQAAFGRSVLHSMLDSAGRRILRSDGTSGTAMTDAKRLRIARDGRPALDRTVIEVDVPDQDLLSRRLPGMPAVRFHAGGELRIHNVAMRMIAWLVEHGIVADGTGFMGAARFARRLTAGFGDGRSAMSMAVEGVLDGRHIRRTWNLVAERGLGPRIPCLVIPAVIEHLRNGTILPGAGSAVGIVRVDEVLSRMPEGALSIRTKQERMVSLYERTMPGYERLAPQVRAMHDGVTERRASGRADIMRGRSIIARMAARIFRLPPAGEDVPVTVSFGIEADGERWTRDFGGDVFSSIMKPTGDGIEERFGPFSFRFHLEERDGMLGMIPAGWTLLGLELPRWLMPNGVATEREENGRFVFDVPMTLPMIGLIVHYRGWLAMHRRDHPSTERRSTPSSPSAGRGAMVDRHGVVVDRGRRTP